MCTKDTRPATQQPRTVLGRFVREVRLAAAGAAIIGSRAVGVGVRPRWRYGNDEMLSSRLVDPPTSTAPSQNGHTIYTTHCYNNVYTNTWTTTTKKTTFGFCLTCLFSRDHSRLGQVPRRSHRTHSRARSVLRQRVYCVCPSVRPSHAGIVSKQQNLS